MSRNYYYYTKNTFIGGQNDTDEPDQIGDDQAVLIQDAITDSNGVLTKRSGNVYVGNELAAEEPVVGLFNYITDAGTSYELRMETTNFQYNNSGTWTNIDTGFTTGLDTWFTQANNKVYISNGTDNTHSWDGTTVTDLGASYPKAKYSAWWKNYFFLAGGAFIGATNHRNRVFFSNLGDPDTMTTGADYFDVAKSDGQSITGIYPLGQFLVIFKRRSIHILTGSNPDEWKLSASVNNVVTIANGIGCVSAKSIVQVGNDLWFMSDDGIRSVRRNEEGSVPLIGLVSRRISGTIDSINKSAYSKVCGTFFDNKVYMAIPTGTSTTNDKVMVANTRISLEDPTNPHPWFTYQGWTPYVFGVHLSGGVAQLHWGDSLLTNVLQGETGEADEVGSIDMDVRGKMIDLGYPEMKKTFRFMKYGAKGSGDYDLSIFTSTNGSTYTLRGTKNLQQGNVWDTATWGVDYWSYVGEVKDKLAFKIGTPQLQVRFRQQGNSQPTTLYPYTLAIKKRKIK
jgi:hypothetical protein